MKIKWLIYSISLLVFSTCMSAQVLPMVDIEQDFTYLSIGKQLSFMDDSTNSCSAQSAYLSLKENSQAWYQKNQDIPNFGNQKTPRWVYFSLSNKTMQEQSLILEITNAQINELQFYELNPDGEAVFVAQSGDRIPFEHRIIKHRHNLFNISLGANQEKEFLLYVKKDSALNLPMVIWNRSEYFPHDQRLTLIDGIYFGLLLLIVIYALVLSISLREILYPIYGSYVFLLALTLFSIKGYGYQYIYSKLDWTAGMTVPDFGVIGSILFILFTFYFLDLKKHANKYFKFLRIYLSIYIFIYLTFNLIPGFIENNLLLVMRMYYSLFLLLIVLGLSSGFVVFRKNTKTAAIYLVSNLFMIGGIVFYAISEYGIIPLNFFTKNSMIFGSVSEMLILSLGIAYKVKQISDEKFKLLKKTASQSAMLSSAIIEGEQQERKRIAEELHDGVGANLSLLKNRLISKMGSGHKLIKEMDNLSQEVREISHSLMPNLLNIMGLKSALMDLFEKFSANTNFKVSVQDHDFPDEIKDIDTHSIYRIVQEVLNNITKHAEPDEVIIQLFGYDDEIQITIDDDGLGFDMLSNENGIGLNSIQGRAESIGATLIIDSSLGKGTSVMLVVLIGENFDFLDES